MAITVKEGSEAYMVGNLVYDPSTRKWFRQEQVEVDVSDGKKKLFVTDPNTAYLEYISQLLEEMLDMIKTIL